MITIRACASRGKSGARIRWARNSLSVLLALAMVFTIPWVPSSPSRAGPPIAEGRPPSQLVANVALDLRGGVQLARPAVQSPVWSNVTAGSTPAGDQDAALAFDRLLNESILFGGYLPPIGHLNEAPQQVNATWAYRNGTWVNLSASVGSPPVGRYAPSLTYDAREGYVLLTGGSEMYWPYNDSAVCSPWCNDTWKFANDHWTRLPLPVSNPYHDFAANGSPVLWEGSTAVYDSTDGFVLVQNAYEGLEDQYGNTSQGSTWSVQGSNWTDLSYNSTTNSTSMAPNYENPVLVNDPSVGGVLLFGGIRFYNSPDWGAWASNSTWLYAHGAWTNVSANTTLAPPISFEDGGIYTGQYTQYAYVGSYDVASQGVVLTNQYGAMWEWKNSQWTNVTPAVGPRPEVYQPAMTWDGDVNATILFGGDRTTDYYLYSNSTWEWTSTPPLTDLSIASNIDPIDSGIPTNFSAAFLGGTPPLTYGWSFGDGGTSSAASPPHAFTGAANRSLAYYNVSLNLSDVRGHFAHAWTIVTVTTAASLAPQISPNPTDVGLATTFFAGAAGGTAGRGLTVVWNFGDAGQPSSSGGSGNNSSSRNGSYPPSAAETNHTYAVAGTYAPQIWWNDSSGSRLTKMLSLQVNPALRNLSLVATPADPFLGQLVNFSATLSGGTQPYHYAWQFGDGGTGGNLADISHVYTTNGPFVAQITITDSAGAVVLGTESITTALNLSAFANVSFGAAPLPVGFGSHVSGGTPGYRYAWTFGDGGTSPLSAPQHVYSSQGVFRVTVAVTDQDGNSAANSWNVTVATGGGPVSVSLRADSTEVPLGASDTILAAVQGGQGAYVLRWTTAPAGCRESGLTQLNCTPTAAGQFAVSLTVTDTAGVSGNATTSFSVGDQSAGTHAGPSQSSAPLGVPPWLAPSAVLAVGLIAIVLGVVIGRRGGGGSSTPPPAADSRYSAYRAPPVEGTGPPLSGTRDPVDDLF